MQDEVLFRRQESIPIRSIGCKVNFFSGPEGSFGLLAHPPDVVVLDGEEDKRMGIHLDKWLSRDFACSFGGLVVQDLTARGWWRFNGFLRGRRAGGIVSNSSQSSPRMKFVISRKAWYVTTWSRVMIDDDELM